MSKDANMALRVKVVRKLASKNVVGNHKAQIDTVVRWGFASHNRGKVREAVEEMTRDRDAPIEKYGGRDVIRLTSMSDAKSYITKHGGDLPWGLRE